MSEIGSSDPQAMECKQCHGFVASTETIAYHLVDGVLYGWCSDCFALRGEIASRPSAHPLRAEQASRAA